MYSGTTWMSAIVPLIFHDGDQDKVNNMGHIMQIVPFVELNLPGMARATDILKERSPPRILKTHLRYEFLQKQVEEDRMKVILMFRNPKDTIVSFYHFYVMNQLLGQFPGTFHEFFQLVKAGHLQYGDLFDWYKDWWTNKKDQGNILVVKYEDLITDGLREVKKIAKFCNKDMDDSSLKKIVNACAFKNMKVNPSTKLDLEPFNVEKGSFYRKGAIGDWKNHFNEEESKWVDSQCEKHLKPIGLVFDYE